MKKVQIIYLILFLIITEMIVVGCYPSQSVIHTAVAGTMTALSTNTIKGTDTFFPTAISTEELPNFTPSPSSTIEPPLTSTLSPSPTVEPSPSPTIEPSPSENNKFSEVSVQVLDKNIVDQSYLGEFIELPFKVTNNYSKNIKGVEGIMHIKDMFGKKIVDIQWDITQDVISAHDSIYIDGFGLNYNQFMETHQKIYTTPFSNLIFEYEYQTVLFTDGSQINSDD